MKSFVPFVPCALLALALAGCSPSNSTNNATADNVSALASNESTDNSAIGNSAVVESPNDVTPQPPASLSTIWVPGADDKLHLKSVSKTALDAQKKNGDPTPALMEVIKAAPKYFPPETQVLDYHDDGKTVSVNLNRNFEDADFWSKAGDTTARLALYSLINSASIASGADKPVILQTEKRPISTIGELDMKGPIEPDTTLQAKAGASSSAKSSGSQTGGA